MCNSVSKTPININKKCLCLYPQLEGTAGREKPERGEKKEERKKEKPPHFKSSAPLGSPGRGFGNLVRRLNMQQAEKEVPTGVSWWETSRGRKAGEDFMCR